MKKLVAFFSATGRTRGVAEELARVAQADLYEIEPQVLYTKRDLNWLDWRSRSTVEMKDKAGRPAIKDTDAKVEDYDVIYLGFPIWWYVAPTIVNTFLESGDFGGKKITLFATSGGSGFGETVNGLRPSAPGADIREGKMLNRASAGEIAEWAASL